MCTGGQKHREKAMFWEVPVYVWTGPQTKAPAAAEMLTAVLSHVLELCNNVY